MFSGGKKGCIAKKRVIQKNRQENVKKYNHEKFDDAKISFKFTLRFK